MSLARLGSDRISELEAAKTISLAFSDDPLIRWLRPSASPWGQLSRSSLKWQQRRVSNMNCEHIVAFLEDESDASAKREDTASSPSVKQIWKPGKAPLFGAVAMIEEPAGMNPFSLRKLTRRLKLWLQDLFDPVADDGSSKSRVTEMLQVHEQHLELLRRDVMPRRLWYIDVVAVRPDLQGQGLGGRLMKAILDLVANDIAVLECTDATNSAFYERFGFQKESTLHFKDHSSDVEDFECMLMIKK